MVAKNYQFFLGPLVDFATKLLLVQRLQNGFVKAPDTFPRKVTPHSSGTDQSWNLHKYTKEKSKIFPRRFAWLLNIPCTTFADGTSTFHRKGILINACVPRVLCASMLLLKVLKKSIQHKMRSAFAVVNPKNMWSFLSYPGLISGLHEPEHPQPCLDTNELHPRLRLVCAPVL